MQVWRTRGIWVAITVTGLLLAKWTIREPLTFPLILLGPVIATLVTTPIVRRYEFLVGAVAGGIFATLPALLCSEWSWTIAVITVGAALGYLTEAYMHLEPCRRDSGSTLIWSGGGLVLAVQYLRAPRICGTGVLEVTFLIVATGAVVGWLFAALSERPTDPLRVTHAQDFGTRTAIGKIPSR